MGGPVGASGAAGGKGHLWAQTPSLTGKEAPTAWMNNSKRMEKVFGPPSVPLAKMIEWTADWLQRDMVTLN